MPGGSLPGAATETRGCIPDRAVVCTRRRTLPHRCPGAELIVQPPDAGWIEVVCGPMFSGKTEELIRRLRRALIAGLDVQVFKPAIDDRYARFDIASHDGRTLQAELIEGVEGIRTRLRASARVVGIDEVQFLGEDVVPLCTELADSGRRVIVAGLDQDYMARPFGPMPALLAEAEFVTKSLAICVLCGNPAHRSHRSVAGAASSENTGGTGPDSGASANANPVHVGAAESYQPLCRRCFGAERAAADARIAQGRLPLGGADLASTPPGQRD